MDSPPNRNIDNSIEGTLRPDGQVGVSLITADYGSSVPKTDRVKRVHEGTGATFDEALDQAVGYITQLRKETQLLETLSKGLPEGQSNEGLHGLAALAEGNISDFVNYFAPA